MQFFDFIMLSSLALMGVVFLVGGLMKKEGNLMELVSYIYILCFGAILEVLGYFVFQWEGSPVVIVERCFFLAVCGMVLSIVSSVIKEKGPFHSKQGDKKDIEKALNDKSASILAKIGHVQKSLQAQVEDLNAYKAEVRLQKEDLEALRDRLLKTLQIVNSMSDMSNKDVKKY
jgi:hypothetical protein